MHCLREVPARALPGRRQGFHAVSATVPCWGVRACSACLSKPFLASHDTVALSFCIRYPANITMELPSWLRGKESACQCRTCGFSPWVGMIPGGGNGNPLQYSCLENHYGQRSLVGYSPWSCKELDMTE